MRQVKVRVAAMYNSNLVYTSICKYTSNFNVKYKKRKTKKEMLNSKGN